MRGRSAWVVAATMVLAVACSSGSGAGDDESAGPTTTDALVVGACLERSATVRRQPPAADADARLVDVRVMRLDACSDEVVFEFRSGGRGLPPGYEIGYEAGPFLDFTSEDEFELAGQAFLVIRFDRTGIFEVTGEEGEEEFTPTFDLGRESIIPSGMNHLAEARIVVAPEGMVQWVIGLDSERPFTIDASSLPRPLPDEPAPGDADAEDEGDAGDPGATSSTTTTTTTTSESTTGSDAVTARIVLRIG